MNTGFGGKRWITMGNRLTGGKDLAQWVTGSQEERILLKD
jgi:hypothetical protein